MLGGGKKSSAADSSEDTVPFDHSPDGGKPYQEPQREFFRCMNAQPHARPPHQSGDRKSDRKRPVQPQVVHHIKGPQCAQRTALSQ